MERPLGSRRFAPYTLQAAIAAVHAEAPTGADTGWPQIAGLYDVLWRGPADGLALIDGILARGELGGYHWAHAARADLCRRLGRVDDARASYLRALALVKQEPERRFLDCRLRELDIVRRADPAVG